jgi:hypothetical protein
MLSQRSMLKDKAIENEQKLRAYQMQNNRIIHNPHLYKQNNEHCAKDKRK